MTTWQDTSSWSQGDRDRSIAKEWTLRLRSFAIVLHHKFYAPEAWFVSVHRANIVDRQLESTDPDSAKVEAVFLVRKVLAGMLRELEAAP